MLGLTLLVASFLGFQQAAPATPATAVITGKVLDRTGLPLAGATVTLEAPPPAVVRGIAAAEGGTFRVDNIVPGTYAVKFELANYATYTRTGLVIAAGQTKTLTVALEVGPSANLDPSPDTPPPPASPLEPGEIGVGIETSMGTFYIAVDPKRAPITTANFLRYVDAKLYDWGRFHRATRQDNYTPAPPNRPMMNIIQGGINPAKRDDGFPAIPLERTNLTGIKHVTGVVSMARGTPDSATSDFFVLLDDQPTLDYGGLRFEDAQGGAAFGHVIAGFDVVKKIQQQPVDGQNLSGPVTIRRVWRLFTGLQDPRPRLEEWPVRRRD